MPEKKPWSCIAGVECRPVHLEAQVSPLRRNGQPIQFHRPHTHVDGVEATHIARCQGDAVNLNGGVAQGGEGFSAGPTSFS